MSEITEAVISNPKTSLLAVAVTNLSNWWIDWGSPLTSAATSILSIILLIVLIRYHLHNTNAIIKDTEKKGDKKD